MHWCPYCSKPCWCDCDDTDFGVDIPDDDCPHIDCMDMIDDDESEE